MSNLTGALSGTKVRLEIELPITSGTWVPIPGETAHSIADTLEAIEITNKSLPDFRCYLESEGRRLLDVTLEAIHNDDATLAALYTAYDAKSFVNIRRVTGTRTVTSNYMITAISDNPSLNTAVSDSFTLSSTGTVTVA